MSLLVRLVLFHMPLSTANIFTDTCIFLVLKLKYIIYSLPQHNLGKTEKEPKLIRMAVNKGASYCLQTHRHEFTNCENGDNRSV